MRLGVLGRRRAPIDLLVVIASVQRKVEGTSTQKKVEIAHTAIKAGYANVFIIDDELARALLEFEQPD